MNLCPSKHPEGSQNTDFRSSKQKSLSNGFIKELRRTKGNVLQLASMGISSDSS